MKLKTLHPLRSVSRLSAAAPAIFLGLFLTGCDKKEPAASVQPATPVRQIVTVYTFDEYTAPELIGEFKARTGIEVEFKLYDETDEMVENLKSNPGEYDVFLSEDGYIPLLAAKRMMKPLDHNRLPNWKNLDPQRLDQPFDPKNEFSVPYLWGTTLLAYRKDMIKDPVQSWKLVFDPALKDKVSFMNERMECYAGVLRSMGLNLPEADQEAIKTAADSMVNLVNNMGLRLGGESEVKEYLVNGDSALSMMYSGDAVRLAAENPDVPIGYFIPEEGATVWTDSFCISRDTTRLDNAYKFLDFMLEAKSAAASANFSHYASPNLAAKPYIDAELLADKIINPPADVLAKCNYFKLKSVDSQREVNKGWRRVQEAWLARSGQVSNDTVAPADSDPEETP
jgi:spermidine/putrescine transport system substrate-binding protein